MSADSRPGFLTRLIGFCVENPVITLGVVALAVAAGIAVAPFAWDVPGPRDPVPVDAIPDLGENQQIVFTQWPGRSPQDIEDQITYPLTAALLGVPGVRTVRSSSMFGFSSIYLVFEEGVEFYWSRSRILERLNSLPAGMLPDGVSPTLGPDATALGQVFWYTLEGRDPEGNATGGWDLDELRSVQDWYVRYALLAVDGVAEVASVGGHVREYQIDVDPEALRTRGVTLEQVFAAVRMSNQDVGARTVEINRVEYVVRGVGFLRNLEDLENTVVVARAHAPVLLKHVAHVATGPALRRGLLDKEGTEAVGGVVVVRYGANPLSVLDRVKERISEIEPGLPSRTLADGTVSRVAVVPFYDRTELIHETLRTLNEALVGEILVTILVVLVLVMHFRSSVLISLLLPVAVLLTFVAMKRFGVDANIVALSGIAIAIGTMVDMGIVITENIVRKTGGRRPSAREVRDAAAEMAGPVLTAAATTVVSFLPVFTMTAAEGKLFRPLAFTKTFALVMAAVVAVLVLPVIARGLLSLPSPRERLSRWGNSLGIGVVLVLLTHYWMPLGVVPGFLGNLVFVVAVLGGFLALLRWFQHGYPRLLDWCLDHTRAFLLFPAMLLLWGLLAWQGVDRFTGWLPGAVRDSAPVRAVASVFPGLGQEFMPALDEGAFLFMPTTMPHASLGEAHDVLRTQDMAISALPEVRSAVGKIGRVASALDPAPISMVETIINYHPEWYEDGSGSRVEYAFDADSVDYVRDLAGDVVPAPDGQPYLVRGAYLRDDQGRLVPDGGGRPFRLWRPELDPDLNPGRAAWRGIRSVSDVWDAIVMAAEIPGTTGAPFLQPIAARLVMLQSGMRAPMGVKIQGPDLQTIQDFGYAVEELLKEVPGVRSETVLADRIVGKPYLEIHIDREAIAHYGIHLGEVQSTIEVAIGGKPITRTVEGRERYPVRVRYLRELRESPDDLGRVLVSAPDGTRIPLSQLAEIRYTRGPQVIKSEDTFLTGNVIFDKRAEEAEVDVVERARAYLDDAVASGRLEVPAGVSWRFAGTYENQLHARKTLQVILPVALLVVMLILYFQFRSWSTTALVFSGIAVAWAGGFVLLWAYGRPEFLWLPGVGDGLRDLFQVGPMNLSVAVWVGFLALFGVATDNGVILGADLERTYREKAPRTREEVRAVVREAGIRRVRPCLMTTATTILALLPVLTSTGKGADIMVPMAIPSFGGMIFVLGTTLLVPVLYGMLAGRRLGREEAPVEDNR